MIRSTLTTTAIACVTAACAALLPTAASAATAAPGAVSAAAAGSAPVIATAPAANAGPYRATATTLAATTNPDHTTTPTGAPTSTPPAPEPGHPVAPTSASGPVHTTLPITGNIIGGLLYARAQIDIAGHRFIGDAGGLFTPGAGALVGGVLHTDDLADLLAHTVSFEVNATPVFVNVNFFAADGRLLGHVEAGAVGVVVGVGGGTGSWS